MNKRLNTHVRHALCGLSAALLASSLGLAHADAPATSPAAGLQTLAELDGKAPLRRNLDVQAWTTSAGSRVLFVEAHELPMFDLRLLFAAGSSQDQAHPGIALLTNAMLNEGVAGQNVEVIGETPHWASKRLLHGIGIRVG